MKKLRRYIGYNTIDEIIEIIYKYKNNLNTNIFIDNGLENNLNADIAYKLKNIISRNLTMDETKLRNILLSSGIRENKSSHIMKITEMFKQNNKNINIDMLSNFVTKIICWTKFYCKTGNEESLLYFGDIKKHDMYFLIMLSFFNIEVVYINTFKEDKFLSIKNIDEYSECINGETSKSISREELYSLINNRSRSESQKDQINSNHRINLNRNDGKPDLNRNGGRLNLNRRGEVSSSNSSLAPVASNSKSLDKFIEEIKNGTEIKFYNGFIGSKYNEEEYKNYLCSLAEVLEDKYKLLRVVKNILPVSNDEIQMVSTNEDKLEFYKRFFLNEFKDNTKYLDIINDFISKNKNVPQSRIENFALKILIWCIRIKEFILSTNQEKALLYFGDIKSHEIYLLKLLNSLGINIVYIFDDKKYNNELITTGKLSLCVGDKYFNITEYPKRLIKEVETTAYAASRVVDNILYNSETGMYRPYSLNQKTIKSVILKTTLDEIFILWNEPSKFRSGFVNDDSRVEIPTLFFKLNGVYEDLSKYFETISKLTESKNSLLIKNVNFYNRSYNNQEFYSGSYLLNKEGFVDYEKIKESKFYKFGYLDKDLQNHIIEKIDEVMTCGCLLFKDDNDFKVRVVMTILDLEERFIKLLQSYNIGEEAPKLIFYNNNKEQYSKEDAIIIMFMSLMGVDIGIMNPTGYVNIENVINEDMIPMFKLERIEYDLVIPENLNKYNKKKSIFKRIFNFK